MPTQDEQPLIYEMQGVSRIITLDLHSREIPNAFSHCNLDNLHASYQIIRELSKIVDLTGKKDDLVIVSPDTGAIEEIVKQVIANNPQPVADFKGGNGKAIGFLVGQVMKESKGRANPGMVNQLLQKYLKD